MAGEQILRPSLQYVARSQIRRPQKCRTFTSTCPNRRAPRRDPAEQMRAAVSRQMGMQGSLKSRMSKAKGTEIPNDLGRFPDTLIKPVDKDLPSLFSLEIKRRLQIELRMLWQRGRDLFAALYSAKWNVKRDPITRKRLTEPLLLAERYYVVLDLHRQLYTAIARGDSTTVNEIACSGLQKAVATRIDQRKVNDEQPETWTIEHKGWTPKSTKTPWLMSALIPPRFKSVQIIADRFGEIPIGKKGRMRQVIAKVRSQQTLDKHDGQGPKKVEVEEYVVIQKMKIDDIEDKWMIWGTTRPSSKAELDRLISSKKSEGSFWDRATTEMRMKM